MTECPQWRLLKAHYLNVPGTFWEQTEISRDSGKQARKNHAVGLLLNPDDAADCDRNGEIIVYHLIDGATPPRGQCHQFIGDPTPEMEPINDEASAISASLKGKWDKAFDTFQTANDGDFSEKLLNGLQKALDKASQSGGLPPTEVVPLSEFNELKAQLAAIQKQIGKPAIERKV